MPNTIGGLPVHPLVVHAVVVLVPLAVLLLVAALVSRRVRQRAGIATPLLATVALAFVPVAKESGEQLQHRLPESDVIRAHAELGDTLLPWMLGVTVTAWALWWLTRRDPVAREGSGNHPRRGGAFIAVVVLAAVASIGTAVQVVRIGDTGARAVWQHSIPLQPVSDRGHGDD